MTGPRDLSSIVRNRFAAPVIAAACLACGAGLNQSNSAKMGEALAFASAAAVAQVVESAAEERARNNAPVGHASGGLAVTPDCDNAGQYACATVRDWPSASNRPKPAPAPDHEMDVDEARDYVLGFVNGVRKLNGAGPLARDESLDEFAQAGSKELAQDHRQNEHMSAHGQDLRRAAGEIQGAPDGSPAGLIQDRLAELLLRVTAEGPDGMHRATLLRLEWRRLGVGIASHGGRTYFTIDFSE
jgi:uncharacterized protein YkwD